MKCYICDREFQEPITNYPDGKNPCPTCVNAYRSKVNETDPEEGEVENIEDYGDDNPEFVPLNLPAENYDE